MLLRGHVNLAIWFLWIVRLAVAADPGQAPPAASNDHSEPGKPLVTVAPVQADMAPSMGASDAYLLGAEDSLSIRVMDTDELGTTPYPIDLRGDVSLPLVGSVHAAGLTITQFQSVLTDRFREYVRNPKVTVSVAEFRSQPVSVLGAVASPGIHQMRGRKTLLEVISEAGGIKNDAGDLIKVTRRKDFGDVPLPGATTDSTHNYSIGQVSIRSAMRAQNPGENITVKPFDVITVPKADLVYVIGDVKRPGGFPVSERPALSVLEALSLAEGLERTAAPKNARILRAQPGSAARAEIPLDVKKILAGQNRDIAMQPDDILFIPNSLARSASVRAIEAIIQVGTGVAIYSHP